MLGLDNMRTRVNYAGGPIQQDRMNEDKLRSLKKALLYSYQAATAVLEDGREFRCLMNPDKKKEEYKDFIISIPFADIRVGFTTEFEDPETGETVRLSEPNVPGGQKTTEGIEPIGMKVGDTFEWKEDKTWWIVYLRMEEERAYFRAEVRNCDYELEINGRKYRGYLRGPDSDETLWKTKHNISWTDVDYNAVLYITADETTLGFFHRFQKLKINGKPWEVQIVDSISNKGLIMVALKETFSNELEDAVLNKTEESSGEIEPNPENPEEETDPGMTLKAHIVGPDKVYPYDKKKYTLVDAEVFGGYWVIDNEKKAVITHQTEKTAVVDFYTGRSGDISLTYKRVNEDDIVYHVHIESL